MMKFRREISQKLRILRYADTATMLLKPAVISGSAEPAFTAGGWRSAYEQRGEAGLGNRSSAPRNPADQKSAAVIEQVLHLRKTYHLGPARIMWYLARYHAIKISDATVYRILKRNGLNHLPGGVRVRKIHTHRYEQRVPGHEIQMDVRFLKFEDKDGKAVKRYQYTAIDDATRIRALKNYDRHNQANAIDFINSVIAKFPFRIREVRTDFQAKFHWHVEDQGIRHAYIKPASPQLNGKGECSHRTDEQEFYQLLSYTGDIDLNAKLDEWERFYNLARPHGAFKGKAPYEILREKI